MAQFDKHISDTRRLLLRPSRSTLDDGDLAEYVIEAIDQLVIDLNSTGEPWFIQSGRVDVVAGVGVYPLSNLPNFGRARYLYTMDDSDPNFQRRPVELASFEDLQGWFGGGDTLPTSVAPLGSVWKHTAAAAAVYYLREAPGPGDVIEFAPVPNQSATYKLIYEPDVVRPQAAKDQGFRLQQFDGYVAALTARRALNHCTWKGLPEEKEDKRKKDIRDDCDYAIGSLQTRRGYAWQFWCWMQSSTQRSEPTVIGWAEDRR